MGIERVSPENNRAKVTSLDHVKRKQSPSNPVKEGRVWYSALDCGHGDWFYGNEGAPS